MYMYKGNKAVNQADVMKDKQSNRQTNSTKQTHKLHAATVKLHIIL